MTVTIVAAVDTSAVAKKKDPATTPEGVDAELVGRLVEQARAAGLQLTGEGGLLQHLTKRVIEAALDGEITDHLGYENTIRPVNDGGNSRNDARAKTVLTDVGPVEITVPRDRDGSFEPQIVKKRQRRLSCSWTRSTPRSVTGRSLTGPLRCFGRDRRRHPRHSRIVGRRWR